MVRGTRITGVALEAIPLVGPRRLMSRWQGKEGKGIATPVLSPDKEGSSVIQEKGALVSGEGKGEAETSGKGGGPRLSVSASLGSEHALGRSVSGGW